MVELLTARQSYKHGTGMGESDGRRRQRAMFAAGNLQTFRPSDSVQCSRLPHGSYGAILSNVD
jgi:hypothetical protein